MIRRRLPWLALALILGAALALMWPRMRDDTATNDEPAFLGAGYSYWLGHRYHLNVEHPPLMQLWSGLPLVFLNVNLTTNAQAILSETNDTVSSWMTEPWDFQMQSGAEVLAPSSQFYHYAAMETGLFGYELLFNSENDTETLLFWGRFMQALVMLATGLMVFLWAKSLSNATGGLVAAAAWCFNPLALAYGHLIITDPGIALMSTLAIWMFSRFLATPRPGTAFAAGITFGAALLTKYTAIILVPIFAALAILALWKRGRQLVSRRPGPFLIKLLLIAVVAWATVLALYLFRWSPAPPISLVQAQRLHVPSWFPRLRWMLIPRDFFKGLAILLLHVTNGHHAYLLGDWSDKGWWYYYPVAILVKTPVALLVLTLSTVGIALWRVRRSTLAEAAPLIAAAAYLACAMTSRANIGIRHVLPVYPLLAVVAGVECVRTGVRAQILGWLLIIWLAVTAFAARSDYIAYFNELVGGPAHGQDCLVDSNYDWGQNGRALQQWAAANHITHVYIDYFGTGAALRHLRVPVEFVKAPDVPRLRDGYLVISATHLMAPDYDWLRKHHPPVARIANTLFVYALPPSARRP